MKMALKNNDDNDDNDDDDNDDNDDNDDDDDDVIVLQRRSFVTSVRVITLLE